MTSLWVCKTIGISDIFVSIGLVLSSHSYQFAASGGCSQIANFGLHKSRRFFDLFFPKSTVIEEDRRLNKRELLENSVGAATNGQNPDESLTNFGGISSSSVKPSRSKRSGLLFAKQTAVAASSEGLNFNAECSWSIRSI